MAVQGNTGAYPLPAPKRELIVYVPIPPGRDADKLREMVLTAAREVQTEVQMELSAETASVAELTTVWR